jgi:hypothetical protein
MFASVIFQLLLYSLNANESIKNGDTKKDKMFWPFQQLNGER